MPAGGVVAPGVVDAGVVPDGPPLQCRPRTRLARFARWIDTLQTFELVKLFGRLQATWSMPSAEQLRRLDDEVLPAALKASMLRPAVVAATAYCGSAGLRCDFVLQPMMFDRKSHTGPEATMADILAHVYPRLDRRLSARAADSAA